MAFRKIKARGAADSRIITIATSNFEIEPLSAASRASQVLDAEGPGVSLRSTPGRGPQPSISAGVEDFMPSAAPRPFNWGTR
jgi:hypothetical protein